MGARLQLLGGLTSQVLMSAVVMPLTLISLAPRSLALMPLAPMLLVLTPQALVGVGMSLQWIEQETEAQVRRKRKRTTQSAWSSQEMRCYKQKQWQGRRPKGRGLFQR